MNDADFAKWISVPGPLPEERPLPDVDLIWAKAEARKRVEASERATRPIRIAGVAIAAACLCGAVAIFPHAVIETLDPTVLRLTGVGLAGAGTVSMLLLRRLCAED